MKFWTKLTLMHRGFILTAFLIFFFGLIVIFILYLFTNPKALENFSFGQIFNKFSQTNQSSLVTSSPVTTEPVSISLNLSSPDDNILVFESSILISGKTSPNATVILSLDEEDRIIEAKASGNFSDTVKLKEGVNNLIISTFDNQGNGKSESRTIYYSKEKL